tara:strand:+ start:7507 stop:8652 length:1146 start_codon:yes stop_codon:yes gene_type:complete
MIPYSRHSINNNDLKEVSKALKSNFLTIGPYLKKFEERIKLITKAKYSIACSSGTAAIHLVLLSTNIKKDDVIIMPAVTFVASFNTSRMLGAKIYLADVDPATGQMTPETLKKCIKENNLKKIKVIFTMYLGGSPENVDKFFKIKKKYNSILIEDACHAFGAKYKLKNKLFNVGCCKHSDYAVFSFHAVKSITTGEGGGIVTNNLDQFKKIQLLRSHGIIRKKFHWDYEIALSGLNYRIPDINCALGYSQSLRIKSFIKKRKKIYSIYKKKLKEYNDIINFPVYENISGSAFHLIVININFKKLKKNKNDLLGYFIKNKIISQFHYIPIYKFKVSNNFYKKKFPGAEIYFKNSLSLPVFTDLSMKKLNYIILKIKQFIDSN